MHNKLNEITDIAVTAHTFKGGGSTNVVTGETPKTGYMVAVTDSDVIPGPRINWGQVEHFVTCADPLKDFRRANNLHNAYLGTWYDSQSNLSYIEISIRVETEVEAQELAERYHQRAIYDVSRGHAIFARNVSPVAA